MTYSKKILSFLVKLELVNPLPKGVEVMNPYKDETIFKYCKAFYSKYYNNNHARTIILGINPGRFGAGLTGIPFTDPIKLELECGIKNDLPKKRELSADFIYQMIDAYGGKEKFYNHFYFGSVSPLGFTRDGNNLNYYDDPKLQKVVMPFICKSLEDQLLFGISRRVAYILGEGKNFRFLSKLNEEKKYFGRIIPLSHPRFIMQYKRKMLNQFIDDYLLKLNKPEAITL